MRFELVTCDNCQTVYAISAPSKTSLATAYAGASYDSADEARRAAESYDLAMRPYLDKLSGRGRALEIGTGTGAYLKYLKQAGFSEVIGIEPSRAAIDAAEPEAKALIREGIFTGDEFPAASFDFICCFQTLEHVAEPRELVAASSRLLRNGGLLALVTHDYEATVNRLLGSRSPIIDIEHLQIFCRQSLHYLATHTGLKVVDIASFANRYRLDYWLRLSPLPSPLKRAVLQMAKATGTAGVNIQLNVGNLLTIARKV